MKIEYDPKAAAIRILWLTFVKVLRRDGVPQAPMSGYASLTRPTLVGKPDVAQRLCGSLQVAIEKTRRLLGWSPALTLDQGLRRAAAGRLPQAATSQ